MFLTLSLAACSSSPEKAAAPDANQDVPPGVTGSFLASCDAAVDCCAQCFEYYGEQKPADFLAMFKEDTCGNFQSRCSGANAIGRCVVSASAPPPEVPEGIETVVTYYRTKADGSAYFSPAQAKQSCEDILHGTWTPLP